MRIGDRVHVSDLGDLVTTIRRLPGRRKSCYQDNIYAEACPAEDVFDPGEAGFFGETLGNNIPTTIRRLPGRRESCYQDNIYSDACPSGDVFDPGEAGIFGVGVPPYTRMIVGPEYAQETQEIAKLGAAGRLHPGAEYTPEAHSLFGFGQVSPNVAVTAGTMGVIALNGFMAYVLIRSATHERTAWKIAEYIGGGLFALSTFALIVGALERA